MNTELPKLYVVKSTRDGVNPPVELQVKNIKYNAVFRITNNGQDEIPIDRYILDKEPFEVDIQRNYIESIEEQYATGIGDLWSYTYYSSFSKEDADNFYEKESIRIKTKYPNDNHIKSCKEGYNGDCCCICEYWIKINKHPWNVNQIAKGSISKTMGHGCTAQFSYAEIEKTEKIIYFSDREHGCCELFSHKNKS